jgi:type IV secretory pathway TrbF-like protein
MLIAADSVSGFAFKHGPAQVTPGVVAPEKLGTAGQIAVAAKGIRALVMQTAPATAHTGQIRHAILRVLRGLCRNGRLVNLLWKLAQGHVMVK